MLGKQWCHLKWYLRHVTLTLAPIVSHDQKYRVAYCFNHRHLMNAMVLLTMPVTTVSND